MASDDEWKMITINRPCYQLSKEAFSLCFKLFKHSMSGKCNKKLFILNLTLFMETESKFKGTMDEFQEEEEREGWEKQREGTGKRGREAEGGTIIIVPSAGTSISFHRSRDRRLLPHAGKGQLSLPPNCFFFFKWLLRLTYLHITGYL